MPEVDDNSVHLGVTSPPYNANKPYGRKNRLNPDGHEKDHDHNSDAIPWENYIPKHRRVIAEMFRVLVPGGRFCVNVGTVGRYKQEGDTPYRAIPLDVLWWFLCVQAGFIFEGKIIWSKINGEKSGSHGSWRTYTRPIIQDMHEYILIFTKPFPDGSITMAKDPDHPRFTMTKREFLDLRKSVWQIRAKPDTRHPAIFPQELPENLIQFLTGPGHTIIDPYAGSGTTARAAKALCRNSISYEIVGEYWPLIEDVTLQTSLENFVEAWFLQQPTPKGGTAAGSD